MLLVGIAAGLLSVSSVAASLPPHDLDPTPEHPRNSEGSYLTLRSGRILFEYSQFSDGQQDHSPSAIAEIHSDDQGRTWSQPKVVVPTGTYQNVMSVSLLRLASGKIARFYAVKRSKWLDCHAMISLSSDEGGTWSEPRPVTAAPGYFVLNNDRVIQTKTGRIIVPFGFHRSRGVADEESSWDPRALAIWYYSDDEGASWKESDTWWAIPALSTSGLQEPGVVELSDGSVYAWFRTDQGAQYESISKDNGVSWSLPRPTELKSPVSPASIKRLPHSATLMVVYNDHSGKVPAPANPKQRAPLAVAFSTDGARTWGPSQVIEDDLTGWYCYTAIHFTDDAVLLSYVAGNAEIGRLSRLRLRRIPFASLPVPPN
ncbi:BNR repeat-like domain-containing protein [Opitutus sp. GAS368]|nr:BNR repeat-like domain-containing protein [Opitutus sp. GAS368]